MPSVTPEETGRYYQPSTSPYAENLLNKHEAALAEVSRPGDGDYKKERGIWPACLTATLAAGSAGPSARLTIPLAYP